MEEIINLNSKPIFKDQPILCPWVTSQPYPSSQLIKNKLNEFVKKHAPALNCASSRKSTDQNNPYAAPPQTSSSTHFFYFLRLMQLFPETHPATLHTVLTLSKNNFFFAIDKLLYAQKCKSDLSKKLGQFNDRGRGYMSSRGRQSYGRTSQRYQPMPRTVPNDLAEVQRIVDLAEKPYIDVQSVENNHEDQHVTNRMVKICVDSPERLVHGTQTFVETDNHEVIEIVCYDNEQTVLKQDKDGDEMDIEHFEENVENVGQTMDEDVGIEKIVDENEPPVIVVGTMQESGDSDCINDGNLPC